ncbi:MAG: helix-turn-helix transcriptional regulator [Thermomicrobiales bacterium]
MSESAPVWRNRIKEHREALGISQAELARRIGTTRQHLSLLESQQKVATVETLLRLEREFGCGLDDLIEIEGEQE